MIEPMRRRGLFPLMNRTVNPALRGILRSPLHRLTSGRLALITYTGRKSREEYTIPVLYRDKGEEVTIAVGWPERKVWWRNLTGEGGPVRLVVRGQELRGHAEATRDRGAMRWSACGLSRGADDVFCVETGGFRVQKAWHRVPTESAVGGEHGWRCEHEMRPCPRELDSR